MQYDIFSEQILFHHVDWPNIYLIHLSIPPNLCYIWHNLWKQCYWIFDLNSMNIFVYYVEL